MHTLVLASLAFALLIAANYLGSYFYPGGYLFAQESSLSSLQHSRIAPLAFLAAVMLIGIASSFVFERARTSDAVNASIGANLKKAFKDFRFIAALFVSPIIFNSVYALVGHAPDSMSDYLLAYQNGFFWQTIISGLAGDKHKEKVAAQFH